MWAVAVVPEGAGDGWCVPYSAAAVVVVVVVMNGRERGTQSMS